MSLAHLAVRIPGAAIYPDDAVFWVTDPSHPDEIRVRWHDRMHKSSWRWSCDQCGRSRDLTCSHALAALSFYNNHHTDKETQS